MELERFSPKVSCIVHPRGGVGRDEGRKHERVLRFVSVESFDQGYRSFASRFYLYSRGNKSVRLASCR
jgi:predicted secreted protein